MTDYKTTAIILNSREIKEYDRIYTIFSREYGKKTIIGIGTRKPQAKLAGSLEPLNLSELFLIKCRGFDRARGAIIFEQFPFLRNNLENLTQAQRTIALLNRLLPENEPNSEIFELLKQYLKLLNRNKENTILLRQALFLKTIAWTGHNPQLFACAGCGNKLKIEQKYAFFAPDGIKCNACQRNSHGALVHIDQNTVKLLRLLLTQKAPIIEKIKANNQTLHQTQQITQIMVENILGRKVVM